MHIELHIPNDTAIFVGIIIFVFRSWVNEEAKPNYKG